MHTRSMCLYVHVCMCVGWGYMDRAESWGEAKENKIELVYTSKLTHCTNVF